MDALTELKTKHLGLFPTEAFIRRFAVLPHEVSVDELQGILNIHGSMFEVPLISTPTLGALQGPQLSLYLLDPSQ